MESTHEYSSLSSHLIIDWRRGVPACPPRGVLPNDEKLALATKLLTEFLSICEHHRIEVGAIAAYDVLGDDCPTGLFILQLALGSSDSHVVDPHGGFMALQGEGDNHELAAEALRSMLFVPLKKLAH